MDVNAEAKELLRKLCLTNNSQTDTYNLNAAKEFLESFAKRLEAEKSKDKKD